MTNQMTNHYYHDQKQEYATRATSPVLRKITTHSSATEENSTMTLSPMTSSSPLFFNNNNKMMASANHRFNHDTSGDIPLIHKHHQPDLEHRCYDSSISNKKNLYSRGPLSPQSAPPTTSALRGWSSASIGSTTPVPSIIHTQEGRNAERTMTKIGIPTIYRSTGNMIQSTGNLISKKTSTNTSKVTGKKIHHPSKQKSGNSSDGANASSGSFKKQRRLERNRLSAQLSRRRRKHYLEELEDRVVQLSLEMDSGRRNHAFQAMDHISELRQQVLLSAVTITRDIESSSSDINGDKGDNMMLEFQLDNSLRLLESAGPLSRTNNHELLVLNSFLGQQLKSFSLPSHTKFILWLTLQGDLYFRGGRAASERLSAARIGERMLSGGNDKVTPVNAMWPLVCNEVGLSYESEERVRQHQTISVLQDKSTWLDRHTARSSSLVMQSYHDSVGGTAQMIGRRESETIQQILTPSQRVKYLAWAGKNSARIKARLDVKRQREIERGLSKQEILGIEIKETGANNVDIGKNDDSRYELNQSYHSAANLYILNHHLHKIHKDFPYQRPSSLTPAVTKKLMRRASFELLGQHKDGDGLSHEDSFASSESIISFTSNDSLMKSSSSLSFGGSAEPEDMVLNQITPQVGEQAAADTVEHAIGFLKSIIPPIPKPVVSSLSNVRLSMSENNNMKGTTPAQDCKSTLKMNYHGHQTVVPTPVRSYGHIQFPVTDLYTPLAPAPLPNQHVVAAPYHKQVIMQHLPPVTTVLNGQNPPPPMTTPTSSQIEHIYRNYQQPEQPQSMQHYPPQQQTHYAPVTTASSYSNPQQEQIAPSFKTPAPAIFQEPQATKTHHVRKLSFLPPHLNAVPEDMFPGVECTAADFFELQDCLLNDGDDWGIGVGLDMG
mmetsp:Transcript_224/g.259  ORF Transcript_224/g.259 Transcript_224/m.259 type:complete len:891 (+) Transcript_224:110-2782(+)